MKGNDKDASGRAGRGPCPPGQPHGCPPAAPSGQSEDSPQDILIKALEGHVATLKEQLAASEGRLAAAAADLEAERARADKAISAFASLADRLDQLAAELAWPWWQRLLRRAG